MADAPVETEKILVATYGEHLVSDILKVGHHGSNTSTSELFLDTVISFSAVPSGHAFPLSLIVGEVTAPVLSRFIERGPSGTNIPKLERL